MGIFDKLFGKNEKPAAKMRYTLLDPMMKQFMGRCIGAVKKAGIEAKGTDRFSILVGEQGSEIPLDSIWTQYQASPSDVTFDMIVELAQRMLGIGPVPTVERLFPYVIPESYLAHQDNQPAGIIRPLGHGLHVGLVFDLSGLVEGLNAEALSRLKMTPEKAHAQAIENLAGIAKAQLIRMSVFPDGPMGKPFVLVGGHWAAATAILLPGLKKLVQKPLGTEDVLASIPHRDAMLVFPMGNRASRDGFRAMIKEKESDGQKPLTFELFKLTDEGVKTFQEQ